MGFETNLKKMTLRKKHQEDSATHQGRALFFKDETGAVIDENYQSFLLTGLTACSKRI